MKKSKVVQASKFLISALRGDVENLSLCLSQGSNINEDADGYGCLHYAIAKDNANTTEIIKILLEAKANINAIDKKGCTPLMHAVKKNNLAATQILIDYKANISAQDLQGNDALKNAIISKSSPDIIRLLINSGADINSSNFKGITPLILATKFDDDQIVELLIDRGANIFIEDVEHRSALYYAALNNNIYTLQTILRAGSFKKEILSNHDILTQFAYDIATYFEEHISDYLPITTKDFDTLSTFMKITSYLLAYGSNMKVNEHMFAFLANYYPSMIYHLSTQNPLITLTATANMLCTFLDYTQEVGQIEKSHITITFAIFKIFRLLIPMYIPPSLEVLRERLYIEVIDSKNWEMQVEIVLGQNLCNLIKNEAGQIVYKPNALIALNTLIPYLKAELVKASKAKNVFYIIEEINLLRDSLYALNKTEAYKNVFYNLLNQLEQTEKEGQLLLTQKQLQHLIPPPTARVVGNFKLTSQVDLNKIQDLKSFFAHDKEIIILESQIQPSNDNIKFTITLSLPYEEAYYSHYNQICRSALDQLQSLCKTDSVINEEIHFLTPNDKYRFPKEAISRVLDFLSKQECFHVAVTGKKVFSELCSKTIAQYNELKQVEHHEQLEEQIQNLNVSGDLSDYYTT